MLFHARKGTLLRFSPLSRKHLIHRIRYTNKTYNVMKKNNYVTPESELLIVRFEENIMSPYPTGNKGYTGVEWDNTNTNDYTDDDL